MLLMDVWGSTRDHCVLHELVVVAPVALTACGARGKPGGRQGSLSVPPQVPHLLGLTNPMQGKCEAPFPGTG